ncbi:MAG: four helix bundle protein, partial [Candidatus Omnitrophica bacterium]|nr:four helix bundle protein [Candidatus Omnitrophota bacterium]
MKTKSFKDLIVWQKAYTLVIEIYRVSKVFPKDEIYGLSQQMRRCSVSIPSNIAEGYGRYFDKEYKQFLSIAYGSLCELETQYLLSIDLGYTDS